MEVKNDDPVPKFAKDHQNPNIPNDFDAKGYNLNGKIMLCAIILLFFIIVLMLCLHIYARWYLLQSRRRRNRLRRRTQLVFFSDNPTTTTASAVVASRGLDASVIAKLPLFFYDPKTQLENVPECAVCLSEFESGETGRVLPKCKHSFHTECIDMWFHSHDTCPLCRAPVEAMFTRPEVVITVCEPETGSSSGLIEDESGSRTGEEVGSSSVGLRRKPSFTGVTVEVPTRNEDFRDESPSSTQSSFRSMLSFKRILSMDWKGSVSPSSCGGSSSATEVLSSNPDKNSRSNNIGIDS